MIPDAIVPLAGDEFDPELRVRLAHRFGLPIVCAGDPPPSGPVLGRGTAGALELRIGDGSGPLSLQFDRTSDRARRARGSPLARAIGVARGVRRVFDATAGLGDDAFTLLCAGCDVTLCERLPWLAALLDDALQRAGLGDRVRVGDARARLLDEADRPEAVYLDPMYAPPQSGNRKSALPRRAIQVLRHMTAAAQSADDDADLLRLALAHATRRVVVKRNPRAAPLGGVRPSGSIASKLVRFDIYAIPGASAPASATEPA